MLGRTHAVSGAVAWLAVSPITGLPLAQVAAGTAVCAAAALAPDLDEPGAKMSRLLGPLRHPVCMTIRRLAGGHRRGTHYLVTHMAFAGLVAIWSPWIALAVFTGLTVHTLGDCCTVGGVQWLWPLKVNLRGPILTGGLIEKTIITPGLTVLAAWLTYTTLDGPAAAITTKVIALL